MLTGRVPSGRVLLATAALALGILTVGLPGVTVALEAAAVEHVHISGFAFVPDSLTIAEGDTVTWDNHDSAQHTVTANDGTFESGIMGTGATFSFTFDTAGTYAYFCAVHPGFMDGVITVEGDIGPAPDLTVTQLTATETTPGVRTTVTGTITNVGSVSAPATNVLVTYRYQGGDHDIGSTGVGPLAPGDSDTFSVTWDTTGKLGEFRVDALADAGDNVVEGSEGNNRAHTKATVLVPGLQGIDALDPV